MTDDDRTLMREEIARAIKETVNGKIDGLSVEVKEMREEHQAHMEEIKPFIQAKAGLSILSKGFLWLGSLAAAYFAIKSAFPLK